MDKIICRADIGRNKKTFYVIWYIIAAIIFVIGVATGDTSEYGGVTYWFSGEIEAGLAFTFIILPLIVIPIIYNAILKVVEKNCSLNLTDSGIVGERRKLFSSINLQLPIDKVDSIAVMENLGCKLWGGQIVAVRSVSGLIKFPWVQNADEFVRKTLEKIEDYKKSIRQDNKKLVSAVVQGQKSAQSSETASNRSSADKLKELKALLDSGIISQEDFDAKKKELLSRM